MRLYLAVAVLMLAFVASTEAQEETIRDRLSSIGQTVLNIGKKVVESAKDKYDEVKNSKVVNTSRNWFQDRLNDFGELFQ